MGVDSVLELMGNSNFGIERNIGIAYLKKMELINLMLN